MALQNFTYDEFLRYRDVSRETFHRLHDYVKLLKKWQNTINLVSATTLETIWTRHIIDSAQLSDHIKTGEKIVDVGSGGGFPGLVIAILGVPNITLVESDVRKAAFLKEAARITNTQVIVVHARIESLDISRYSLIIARAFAPLDSLLNMLGEGLMETHNLLLLKGKAYESEIGKAKTDWAFDYKAYPSVTDKVGIILSIQNLKRTRDLQ